MNKMTWLVYGLYAHHLQVHMIIRHSILCTQPAANSMQHKTLHKGHGVNIAWQWIDMLASISTQSFPAAPAGVAEGHTHEQDAFYRL